MERETGIEPATSSLGSWRSTAELLPLGRTNLAYHRERISTTPTSFQHYRGDSCDTDANGCSAAHLLAANTLKGEPGGTTAMACVTVLPKSEANCNWKSPGALGVNSKS